MKQSYKTDIKLGEKYRDEQSGIEGVATSIHFYQHACERVTLEKVKTDGELMELTFDSPRLTHIRTGVTATTTRTGGPARAGESRHEQGPVIAQVATLAVAHIDALDIDVLVTTWDDGTGELAYRPGREQTRLRWSPPVPLEVAP